MLDEHSTDDTVAICQAHPAVVEVIQTNLYDADRARADCLNRQLVLTSALRYQPDWIAYFDADEHWHDFTLSDLQALDDYDINAIASRWHDVYITPDDVDRSALEREWVSNDLRVIPLLFRNHRGLSFTQPDQRIMHHRNPVALNVGHMRHYGLGWSEAVWERKCDYYSREWPKYSAKWQQRYGQAVRENYDSVAGTPLIRWSERNA